MSKIESIQIKEITIPLRTRFKIATGSTDQYRGVIVSLTTDDGVVGLGESAPSPRVTGEDCKGVTETIEKELFILVKGIDIRDLHEILKDLAPHAEQTPAATAAMDIALHDCYGRTVGTSITEHYGKVKRRIATSITLVIGSVDETVASAAAAVHEYGARELKIKIGADIEADIKRIAALRDQFDDNIGIRVDANTGYTVNRAVKALGAMERYDIRFVEEPLTPGDIEGYKELRKHIDIPIMADEAAKSPRDASELAALGIYDMFNIKLMKCGGIASALKIAGIAGENDMKCQVGCMIETAVGITAGTVVALCSPSVKFADLDGYTFLTSHPFLDGLEGGAKIEDGCIRMVGDTKGIEIRSKGDTA